MWLFLVGTAPLLNSFNNPEILSLIWAQVAWLQADLEGAKMSQFRVFSIKKPVREVELVRSGLSLTHLKGRRSSWRVWNCQQLTRVGLVYLIAWSVHLGLFGVQWQGKRAPYGSSQEEES